MKIVNDLRRKIDESLLPLITSDYVLWGLPYYINPGDNLIWEGTLDFLSKCGHKCVGTCGWNEYKYVPLKEDVVILIIGGGYFGDLWRNAWKQVVNTVTQYPANPIVVMPQSIHYNDEELAKEDASRLAECKNLTICTRDVQSYEYSRKVFAQANNILVPDMAFHMNMRKLLRIRTKETDKTLYLKRKDKELPSVEAHIKGENVETRDWPLMSGTAPRLTTFLFRCFHVADPPKRHIGFLKKPLMYYGQRNLVTRDAVKFIGQYKTIYTTRLHVMVLAFLLGKEVYIIDNSYKKVSGCYETWLKDSDNIKIYGNEI